jgi:hypothetical protein
MARRKSTEKQERKISHRGTEKREKDRESGFEHRARGGTRRRKKKSERGTRAKARFLPSLFIRGA